MVIKVPENYTYLDWAATAPLCKEALEAMKPFLIPGEGNIALGMNANSLHSPGRASFEALELARREIARCIGAKRPNDVIITSGATDADNMAVLGIARAAAFARHLVPGSERPPRFVTSGIEHDAVLSCAKQLKREGFDVVYVRADRQGFVHPEALVDALDDRTVLVSIQAANSEVGSIQPIKELCTVAHEAGALMHTDAVQAFGKLPLFVSELNVDAASFAGHKIGGPKGVGALYLKSRTPFEPLMLGGGQEDTRRSGTQNVCGAVGFSAACTATLSRMENEIARERELRDSLYSTLSKIPGVTATVRVAENDCNYLPNIVHVLVDGLESETMILKLDKAGFGVSGGSACSSHSLEPSHVLKQIGVPESKAFCALRISFGHLTTKEQLDAFVQAFANMVG